LNQGGFNHPLLGGLAHQTLRRPYDVWSINFSEADYYAQPANSNNPMTRIENPMAKKPARGEKSQAIRDYLAANKKAKGPEVVAALAEKGIKVSLPMVYNLKARNRMGRRRRKAEAGGQAIGVSLDHLLAAKKLVDSVGSIEKAKSAVEALAKLV